MIGSVGRRSCEPARDLNGFDGSVGAPGLRRSALTGRADRRLLQQWQQASSYGEVGVSNQWGCQMAEFTPPAEGILLAHFIVSDDVERSRRFYSEVLGGKVIFSGEVTYVALANSWIIINVGGGPTDDKPTVTLETPRDPDRVSSFLNIRVADIQAVYTEWSARGAQFLTPPKQHQYEIRCYIRDPDGYLIEVGQTTDPEGDWSAWLERLSPKQ
jgi:catechol 2,3-dioxygenase-like lactoylglutathione lyase family enzyme